MYSYVIYNYVFVYKYTLVYKYTSASAGMSILEGTCWEPYIFISYYDVIRTIPIMNSKICDFNTCK